MRPGTAPGPRAGRLDCRAGRRAEGPFFVHKRVGLCAPVNRGVSVLRAGHFGLRPDVEQTEAVDATAPLLTAAAAEPDRGPPPWRSSRWPQGELTGPGGPRAPEAQGLQH